MLFRILHILSILTGPNIFLSIYLSKVRRLFSSFDFKVQVSDEYVMTGLIIVHCGEARRKPVLLGSPELHISCGNAKYSDLLIDVVIVLHDNAQPHGTEDSELTENIWVGNVRPLPIQFKFGTQ
jgi:hypothetical protein